MYLLTPILHLIERLLSIIIALFGIGFLIGFHELGHFLFCKLFGIKTPSFSIGFGPRLWSRKIGGTEFIISAIPLGGFVEIAGANELGQGEQKEAQSTAPDSFASKPYYQKFLVMMGGILCNFIFAYFVFILLSFIGLPKTPLAAPPDATVIIAQVEPDSPAAHAHLTAGDMIQSINNIDVANNMSLALQTVQASPGKTVPIVTLHNGSIKKTKISIESKQVGNVTIGSIGITLQFPTPSSFIGSIKQGIALTNHWIVEAIKGFASIFQRADLKGVGGPIVIISILTKGVAASIKFFLILLAIISINLAILNLIPLPILDGGQLLFYTIEAIAGRPLPLKVREYIHIASWLLVLGLILYLSLYDIARLAHPYIESITQFLGFGR